MYLLRTCRSLNPRPAALAGKAMLPVVQPQKDAASISLGPREKPWSEAPVKFCRTVICVRVRVCTCVRVCACACACVHVRHRLFNWNSS